MSQNEKPETPKAYWKEWFPPKHFIFTGEEKLFVCSNCFAKYEDITGFRFCPFCGSFMYGEEA